MPYYGLHHVFIAVVVITSKYIFATTVFLIWPGVNFLGPSNQKSNNNNNTAGAAFVRDS
jgi:hypothetical protein